MLVALVLAAVAPGCTQFTDSAPLGADFDRYELYGPHTVGMQFVSHHAGLDGISVLIHSQASTGEVTLRLRESPGSVTDIAAVTIFPSPSQEPIYQRFSLPLQGDANGRSFFLVIESPDTDPRDSAWVPYRADALSTYMLYLDGEPAPGQLSFELHYNPVYIAKDLAKQALSFALSQVAALVLTLTLYLLPGAAAVVWLLRDGDWIERLIVATGLSVAIHALFVYTTMTGLRMSPALVIGYLVLCALLVAIRAVMLWRSGRLRPAALVGLLKSLRHDLPPLVLLVVFVSTLGVRLFTVRDLAVPMWGDSQQHTMIVQLMADNGGLFDSWQPYAPLKTFTYHFGFHANAVLYHWLSGDTVVHSVVWIGQVLNALAALVLYPLAVQVSGGRRWAGVGAVLVAGWLSPMPMYYVNWGRYTQLAAQTVLPVAAWLFWQELKSKRRDVGRWVLLWLAVTGLLLTHYRIAVAAALFLAVGWAGIMLRAWVQGGSLFRPLRQVVVGVAVPLALLAPWFWHVKAGLLPGLVEQTARLQTEARIVFRYDVLASVVTYVPAFLLLGSLLGLAVGLLERRAQIVVLVAWTVLLLLAAYPDWLYVPGAVAASIFEGVLDSFTVFIALYMPVSILCGYLVGALVDAVARSSAQLAKVFAPALVLLLMGMGARQGMTVLDPEYALVTDADLQAMQWIREHTPETAKFLANSFAAFGGNATVGSDAGWWIPILAGRENNVPPITYAHEASFEPGYAAQINDFARKVEGLSLGTGEAASLLRSHGITHVYVGQKGGTIRADELEQSGYYRVAYHEDGVWVFEVVD